MITALAGGVGGAKLLFGLARLVCPQDLTVVVNTGDDMELHGLHISPDLDIAAYSLAGLADPERGWGLKGDSFNCLGMLKRYTGSEWFNLGDLDIATHIFRTELLKQGCSLSEVTARICIALGVGQRVLPMTDDKFETRVKTEAGTMHFEEFMVKRCARDAVLGVEFLGVDSAKPASDVLDSIVDADRVVICPSNPVVSIGTILSVKGVRDALRHTKARRIAVSPIIAGSPVKGPADKLLRGLGHEVSAFGVAKLYADLLDVFVVDVADASYEARIEQLGMEVRVAEILMRTEEDKVRLAKVVLES